MRSHCALLTEISNTKHNQFGWQASVLSHFQVFSEMLDGVQVFTQVGHSVTFSFPEVSRKGLWKLLNTINNTAPSPQPSDEINKCVQLNCHNGSCGVAWQRVRTRMLFLKKNLIYFEHKQKARLSRITKKLNFEHENEQNKTWLELWKKTWLWLWTKLTMTWRYQPDNMNGSERWGSGKELREPGN